MSGATQITFSVEMVERVLREWEEENPGKDATMDMGSDEFARRMMVEIKASARTISAPYPFCRSPEKCAGRGYCPNDPACND